MEVILVMLKQLIYLRIEYLMEGVSRCQGHTPFIGIAIILTLMEIEYNLQQDVVDVLLVQLLYVMMERIVLVKIEEVRARIMVVWLYGIDVRGKKL